MSKFVTKLHIDLTQVTKALPKGAVVTGVKLDEKNNIEVFWECDALVTPYTFPLEFPFQNLTDRTNPSQVKERAQIQAERLAQIEADRAKALAKPEATPTSVMAALIPAPLVCGFKGCGKPIHWNGLNAYVHSDDRKYKHAAVLQKQEVAA